MSTSVNEADWMTKTEAVAAGLDESRLEALKLCGRLRTRSLELVNRADVRAATAETWLTLEQACHRYQMSAAQINGFVAAGTVRVAMAKNQPATTGMRFRGEDLDLCIPSLADRRA